MLTPAIQAFAEQCEADRQNRAITQDVLSIVELETNELDETELRVITLWGIFNNY